MINVLTVEAPDDIELEQKINDLPGELLQVEHIENSTYKLIYKNNDPSGRNN